MYQCEYCGSQLPDSAHFCGNCGKVSSDPSRWPTRASGLAAVRFDTRDAPTALSASGIPPSPLNIGQVQDNSVRSISDLATVSLDEGNEDDEENKRRAAMVGFGLPFLGNQPFAESVPMVQGTPQPAQVPFVQGTPQTLQGPVSAAGHALEGPHLSAAVHSVLSQHASISPQISHSTTPLHLPHPSSHPGQPYHHDHSTDPQHSHHLHHPTDPHHPHHHKKHGHAKHWVMAAIITPIIIIVTIIGAGFTVWAPALSLSGGTDVVQGGTLHLHGSNFIPGSSVMLTLDGTTPLYYTHQHTPAQILALHAAPGMATSGVILGHEGLFFSSSNTITVTGNGTFNALIPIDLSWHLGRHTIRASEAITQRNADLAFTIYLPGTLPTPTVSGTASLSPAAHPKASPSPTKSPTGSPLPKGSPTATPTKSPPGSPTPTATLAGLSCVNPSMVTLGPVSEGYNQPTSVAVTLCTQGSGTVSWNATYDTKAASWLQLDRSSGQIQAPNQGQVNVSALATQLNPGSYTATVTFSSQPSNSTLTLNVTFLVEAGCINATPQTLNFTGVAGISDPSTQTVTISNCGPVGMWSESTETDNGANWLSTSSTGNALNGGATSNVTVTASNLNANLPAGTYSGKLLFSLGSASSIVNVTLTVQAAPTLSVSPSSIYANQQCGSSSASAGWVCYVTLTNNSSSLSLSWSASSIGVSGITFKPSSDTIAPGQSERVEIIVPYNNCQTSTTLIFTGPANTVNVAWTCTVIG